MGKDAPPDVLAVSPVACAAVAWRAAGALRVTVVVKATFALTPDHEASLVDPAPLEREDRYQDQDPSRSLRRGSDLAPYLPGAGVVLIGHAYAPSGSPVTGLAVRLAIYGDEPLLDKTVHVYGDVPTGGSAPTPFLKMPLAYERAYGGPSVPSNPVGVGPAGTRRPNLVHPTNPHRPAGFGPIAPHWPARRRLFDAARGPDARARGEEILDLPAEVDFRAFSAAPADQLLATLGGAEWIVLDNMCAGLVRVRTRLPSAQAQARWHLVSRDGGRASPEQELELVADTLAIDTDLQTASVLWRGSFPLDRPEQLALARVVAGLALPGAPVAWPDPVAVARATGARGAPDKLAHTGTAIMSPFVRPALPFDDQDATLEAMPSPLRARPAAPAREPALTPEIAAMIAAGETPDDPLNRTGPTVPAKVGVPALPFSAAGAPAPPPSAPASAPLPARPEETAMVSMAELTKHRDERAPFAIAAAGARPAAADAPIAGAPWSGVRAGQVQAPEEHTVFFARPGPRSAEPAAPEAPPASVASPAPVFAAPPAPVAPAAPTFGAPPAPPSSAAPPAPAFAAPPAPVFAAPPAPVFAAPPAPVFAAPPASVFAAPPAPVFAAPPAPVFVAPPAPVFVAPPPPLASPPAPPPSSPAAASLEAPAAAPPPRREADPEARARAKAKLADGSSFDDADLQGADLSELDFTGRSLRRCKLGGAILRGAILKGAQLDGAQLEDADLSRARLDDAELGGADLSRAVLTGANLDGARLAEAVLEEAELGGASLVRANLDGAKLARAHGEGANLEGATLRRADLRHASFPRASFAGAALRWAQADQGDFTGARFLKADLSMASFRKARLTSAVLAHATLDGTDLRNADLERANVHATARRTAKMAGANTKGLDEKPPEAS
jgi:uncharacterized protein YjbI with pentapeptide repeats